MTIINIAVLILISNLALELLASFVLPVSISNSPIYL